MDGSTIYANAYARNGKYRNGVELKDHEIQRSPKVYIHQEDVVHQASKAVLCI